MPLSIDYGNEIINITSPTTSVDGQTLHDFVEDNMASPEGLLYPDILQPEGKIEDPTNPGVFSQIILVLNSPWQIQFWGGSGYTRIYGAKIVGGLADQPIKATGTAGDITVLESPVDGVTVATGSGVTEQDKLDIADRVWDETLNSHITPDSASTALRSTVYRVGNITIDIVNGTSGTGWPIGSHYKPSNNLTDTLAIMGYGNVTELILNSDLTTQVSHDISGLIIKSLGKMGTDVIITSGCSADKTTFMNLNLSGTITNGDEMLLYDCSVGNLYNFQGIMNNVAFNQNAEISFNSWATVIQGTAGGDPASEPEFNIGTASVNISQWTGNLKIIGKTGTDRTVINCNSGNIIIDSTCIAGIIQLLGVGEVEDNSGAGCQVDTDAFISPGSVADGVWNVIRLGSYSMSDMMIIMQRMVFNKVTKSGDIVTIYEEDGATPWKTFDLSSGGRVET